MKQDPETASSLDRYFALAPGRKCGDCMVCCEYMPISTAGLIKAAQTLCPYVVVNKGCGAYETRPNVCRTWHCLWRRDMAMSDDLRPDRSGMIFSLVVHDEPRSLFEQVHITCIAMKSKEDFAKPAVAATVARYAEEGILPVWRSFGGGKTLLHPSPDMADAIERPVTTSHPHLVPAGKIWRQQYESLYEQLVAQNGLLESQFVKA